MTQQRLSIAGNKYTGAKLDQNGNIVSTCCEEELVMHHSSLKLIRRGYDLADELISWVCSRCRAVVLGIETERGDAP